ncbi:MAG TPA: heat-shock protein Hsp70, partial [Gammaproteobacteria bacterium]|nr:heat-shock protein Hsp70 [Gammaproteobacteria bacterium]
TNSEVAVVKNGQVEVLEIQHDSLLLPSVVGLADDGCLLVGTSAANQFALHPERTVKSIKRHMGSDYKVDLGGQTYTPQEISALILKRLKAVAEDYLGEPVEKAVITVPAYFSDAQRQATRDAGNIAELDVVRIINEPTAAALAYEGSHSGQKKIMVYDLGGGTFDVSVVRLEKDVVEVLASHGDNQLGGDDFDQKIIDHVTEHLITQHAVDKSALNQQVLARIRRAAEAAKIRLSNHPFAMLEEEYLIQDGEKTVHLSLELSRDEYEDMITSFIDQTLTAAHTALEGADMSVADLDEILLVGGSTRTPLISQRLESELGLQARSDVNPDLCVAMGAAIQGATISGEQVSAVLVDITPYTFGTSAIGMLNGDFYPFKFVPVIRKNSVIPVTKSEVFYTNVDSQESVDVTVYQGEDEDAVNNTEIGRFMFEGLSDVPSGNEIVMTFSLDLNGILQVSAVEKNSSKEMSITIDNAVAQFTEDAMGQAQARISQLFEGESAPSGDDKPKQHANALTLIEKAEALMENASEEDREDLVDMAERLHDAISQESIDNDVVDEAVQQLTDLIFYLES